MNKSNLIGQTFHRLTVVADAGYYQEPHGQRRLRWECICECGNTAIVTGKHLKSGNTKSCGCLQRESVIKMNYRHGLCGNPIHHLWNTMRRRCNDPNQKSHTRYKDRGIIVCDEWLNSFTAFYGWALSHGWKQGLQIDRIDNNGNYEPSNCRFVTSRENALNRVCIRSTNKSGYEGVSMDTESGKWRAGIMVKGKTKHLGRFQRTIDAAKARNVFIVKNELQHEYKIQCVQGLRIRY